MPDDPAARAQALAEYAQACYVRGRSRLPGRDAALAAKQLIADGDAALAEAAQLLELPDPDRQAV